MATLYHYCSNASFLSIISTHKVWASEFTLSNDLLEGKWIRQVVQSYCDEKNIDFFKRNILLEQLDHLIAFIGGAGICLSQEGDLLSQWRAYSDNGSGLSIGFDQSCFGVEGSPLPTLKQVIYDPDVQKQLIQPNMDRAIELIEEGAGNRPSLLGNFGETEEERRVREARDNDLVVAIFGLFPHLYILKNPAFQEEKEWRSVTIIIAPNQLAEISESQGAGQLLTQLKFCARVDRIVPYAELPLDTKLDRPVICEIVLGPRNVTPTKVVEAALLHHGWKGVRVRKSTASYR